MSISVPLFASNLSSSQIEEILADIRSSDYIKEITSGEVSAQESGFWNLVLPLTSDIQTDSQDRNDVEAYISEIKNLDQSKWFKNCLVIADERTLKKDDGSLIVVQLDSKGEKKDQLRAARGSILEICANLSEANMDLSEFRKMCGGAEVFDSGQ